jgi:hypothetical protein
MKFGLNFDLKKSLKFLVVVPKDFWVVEKSLWGYFSNLCRYLFVSLISFFFFFFFFAPTKFPHGSWCPFLVL